MANALMVHKDRLPQSQKMQRAAQYVRMSTDYQRYSIENQAAVIAAYAQLHKLSIVRTYRDEGESGLTIKNGTGLCPALAPGCVRRVDTDGRHLCGAGPLGDQEQPRRIYHNRFTRARSSTAQRAGAGWLKWSDRSGLGGK
jgi:hypothetical protein